MYRRLLSMNLAVYAPNNVLKNAGTTHPFCHQVGRVMSSQTLGTCWLLIECEYMYREMYGFKDFGWLFIC